MGKTDKKIFNKIFWKIFLGFFFVFLTLYVSGNTGYYEFELQKKKVLTEEKIKEFEADIAAGKNVDIKDYMESKEVSYSNNVSKAGLYLSENIGNFIKVGVESTFSFLNKMLGG